MNNLLKYEDFLKESKIDDTYETDDTKHLLLFSDTIKHDFEKNGRKYPLFYPFYEDPTVFYGLNLLSDGDVFKMKGLYRSSRFTLFLSTIYKDTETTGNRNLSMKEIVDIMTNSNDYLFYRLGSGPRTENAAPNREHIIEYIDFDDNKWYWVIKKRTNCSLVKIKSRQEGGYWAEHQLSKLHGWKEEHHDIKMKIRKGGIIIRANNMMQNIMHSSDVDVFTVDDDRDTFLKYDLVIDDGLPTQKRIEVKKYENKEKELWKNGRPFPLMLAEQCKISTRGTLKKIVEWYNEIYEYNKRSFEYIESKRLKVLDERVIHREFSLNVKIVDGLGKIHWIPNPDGVSEICDKIRDYYNDKIKKLPKIFNEINKDRWMTGIYGIYFTGPNRMDRREDFLIRIKNDDGTSNMNFVWKIVPEWLGFNRLKLFIEVKGDAWEYILTEGNNFEKVFQLRNFENYDLARGRGYLRTPNGNFRYNEVTKLWVKENI